MAFVCFTPLKRCLDNTFHLLEMTKISLGKEDYAFGDVHKNWA
jgi:hypothetical protein